MASDGAKERGSAVERLTDLLPIAGWISSYGKSELRGDLFAGLTVGVMLVPQGMAYAVLAGVPPIYGLYASLVPLLVYPILGTSRHLAVGITAIDSLIVIAGVTLLAEPMTDEFVGLVLVLTLMVGVIQIVMGVFRLGFVVNLLSRPVITGFMAAAAITIAFTQLGSLLGISLARTPFFYQTALEVWERFAEIHPLTFGIGIAGIIILFVVRRYAPLLPGSLIIVVFATLLVWLFDWHEAGVDIVGDIPAGLPEPVVPPLRYEAVRRLLPTAITLALVQFMSVISLGKVFSAKHRYTVDANRELIAMGAFNMIGGFFRSVPVSGSFSRSAVGDEAGGRTAMANVVAASVVGITLLLLTPLFRYLPIPIFASIILVAVFGLVDVQEVRFLLRAKRIDGLIAVMTFLATLFIGIHHGVLIGIGASVTAIMYRISRPNVAELGHLTGTRSFRDLRNKTDAESLKGILMLRIDASFSFANADFLRDLILERTLDSPDVHSVIIDGSSINDLDTTAAATLQSVAQTLKSRGVAIYFGGLKEPVETTMRRAGLVSEIGADHFFLSPHRAVVQILTGKGELDGYLGEIPEKKNPDDEWSSSS